jgi:hypothetical protein
MTGLKRGAWAAIVWFSIAGAIRAQPALTTIQDVLYKADGTRFNGTVIVSWNSFQAADGSNIATQQMNLRVVNGVLKVQLIPTTNASAGANYAVTYNASGQFQFSETWAVSPSTTPLRVRDVRVATGTVVGPSAITTPILISDVTGLANELSLLVPKGAGYEPAHAAVVNSSSQLDAAGGNSTDCLHVDGSSGPCGAGGGGPGFVDSEAPAGTMDGVNTTFTLTNTPSPSASLALHLNGILLKQGSDYTVSGNAISFVGSATPQPGDSLVAAYRLPDPNNPSNAVAAQVLCSSTGVSSASTTLTSLGTCTIPAGLLAAGDRINIRFNFSHEGSAAGFTAQVAWGATTLFSRGGASSETIVTGTAEAAIHASGTEWSQQSWGGVLGFTTTVGTAADSINGAITIGFLGQMGSTSADTVTLRNFTVTRYPAIAHP